MSDHYKSNLLLNKLKKISKLFEKKTNSLHNNPYIGFNNEVRLQTKCMFMLVINVV